MCVYVCVGWQASQAQARFNRAEGGQASGEGALTWPRRPSLRGLKGVLLAERL